MLRLGTVLLLLAMAGCGGADHPSGKTDAPSTLIAADAAFRASHFDEAKRLYTYLARPMKDDPLVAERLGSLALLENRLDDAERILAEAHRVNPASRDIARLLAEVYVRRDAFVPAAPLMRLAGRKARASQLESFGSEAPYQIDGPDEVTVPFLAEDPLPLIEARRRRLNAGPLHRHRCRGNHARHAHRDSSRG